ncbi:hypothetical protein QQS21_007148 [Conoideocrella luteorostrata]|uniref:VOC domain-containing protein n=1 Tax=Conoideocrella luteorostrata TaxID=1105319 RepID=A0AAJ0FSQ6_9HYPO|nr:hypothetical protein QQS21_007148 [Conoideocrella luteorostrata]
MSKAATQKIRLVRIAHVYYNHSDLQKSHQFMLDFGFQVAEQTDERIFYKGLCSEPFVYCATRSNGNSFGGAAFAVESIADLQLAAATLPNATEIHDFDGPGGGKMVTFHDPVDGFPVHLLHGQAVKEVSPRPAQLDYNFPQEKHREVNKTQRFQPGPAMIDKLGHFGCCVTNFEKAYKFYTYHFNLKASDLIYDSTGKDISAFLHLDRGMEQVDHHTFFFFEGPKYHVHHSSFEVHDFDVQALGHQWLRDKGHDLVWGIGRHVLGSQIFDYWYVVAFKQSLKLLFTKTDNRFDPSRFILEHYADGDLVDETTPTNREEAGPNSLYIWGPPLPPTFLE